MPPAAPAGVLRATRRWPSQNWQSTGLWVNYEMVDGEVTKAKKVVRKPVEEYLKTQKRFRHLFKPKRQDAEIAAIQAIADKNAAKYGIDIKIKKE